MVIYIDKTVGQFYGEHGLTDDERIFFERLAFSAHMGKCYLCGEITSLDFFSQLLSESAGGIYRKIKASYAENGVVIKSVTRALVIVGSDDYMLPSFFPERSTVLSVTEILKLNVADTKFALIGENLDDCMLYNYIGERYMSDRKIRGVQISLEHVHGAGNTVKDVFKHKVCNEKTPTLCIVDSDIKCGPTKHFKDVSRGNTFHGVSEVEKQLKQQGYKLFEVHCIDAHEVENLIPIDVLQKISDQCPEMKNGIEMMRYLLSIDSGKPIIYYDMKKGISGSVVNDTNQAMGVYWKAIMDELQQNGYDGQNSFPSMSCNRLLKRANEYLNEHYSTVQIDDYLLQLWNTIGEIIYSWGCSNLPIRS